ncbi:MAG TPA: helix-turn-helix domain-containing protein, partial [Thermomicrobiales bacterium]|nr:helix-turn-helix domain-containing protein [Thermomicrobiales bacterium]
MTSEHAASPPFGELLRGYRMAAGLSQEQLAERAGLSARAISDLERGVRRVPYPHTVAQLAAALGLTAPERARLAAAVRRGRAPRAAGSGGAAGRPRHNLPAPLTSFVGREDAVAEVAALLAGARLVTLTGAGGVGKTRLALAVAAGLVDESPGGVWLVELAPLAVPALVPQAVAAALGVREVP